MAVLQMQRIIICALKKERKQILEYLQRRGVVEIDNILTEDSVFQRTDVSVAKNGLDKNINFANDAIKILDQYIQEKKSMLSALNGRIEVSKDTYDAFHTKYDKTLKTAHRIIALSKEIAENKAEILKFEAQIEMLTPWVGLDIPLNFSGTKSTKSFIGTLPNPWTLDAIYEKLADQTPLNVDIISTSKEQTCIFVLCTRDKENAVFELLRDMNFAYPSNNFDRAPSEQLEILQSKIANAQASIEKAKEDIVAYEAEKEDLLFLQDYEVMRSEKYEVIGHLVQSKNVFVITGFIAEKEVKAIEEELSSQFNVSIQFEQPSEEEEVPILLQNNGFSKPLEGVVAAYSPPGKGELDPTFIMSLFYYLLFGLMLSDAGYGAIITIGCAFALIKYKKTMEDSMRNTIRMYLFCGISTVFWGILLGSYFGDIVDVVSSTYLGYTATIPALWFIPLTQPMRMLTFSMLLGIIHLFAGLFMKLYQLLKQKEYKAALYDVVLWLVLLTSSVVLLLSMDMITGILGVTFKVPASIANVASMLAILAAVGIVLTNGRESKHPFKRILKGLYALYGISGYLSDVLSYSRLLALGLATGVIATVINKMAAMAGGMPVAGPIIFIVILIFGHVLNLGINALGAYVHTNRLQYVEFFGKFYEGGGRLFNPFTSKTKYYKIKER